MAANVLQEFLVSLGFKIDDKGLKNFTGSLEAASKGVLKLVAAIEGAALTVGAGVAAFAANMESLYFAAKRAGTSATSLEAFGKAARNMGASSEEAVASVEALAKWMRYTPGSEGFLQSLGVRTRDANGNLRETVDIMTDLGQVLATKNPWEQKSYADILGISDNTLRAITSGQFAEELNKQRDSLKDAGFEEATAKAAAFERKLRELQSRIQAVGVTIGSALLDVLGPQMEDAVAWFKDNATDIAQIVGGIAKAIVTAGSYIGPVLRTVAEGWKNIYDWVKATGEWIVDHLPTGVVDKIGEVFGRFLDVLHLREKVDAAMSNSPASAPGKSDDQTNRAYAYFRKMGWSHEQASGIVANLQAESGLRSDAVGDNGKAYGVAQWHPDRQAAFKKWSGKDIRQASTDEQLAFVQYELTGGQDQQARQAGALLRASKNAQQSGEIMSRYYERPAAADYEAARRGAAAVTLSQNTTINVNGGGDPAATARAVSGEQNRVNQELTRNMQTAVR